MAHVGLERNILSRAMAVLASPKASRETLGGCIIDSRYYILASSSLGIILLSGIVIGFGSMPQP